MAERLEDGSACWAKFMGRMGRGSLPRGDGLWLPGENGIHMLFMRFAIDVLFLSKPLSGKSGLRQVISARKAVPPWRGVVWYVRGAKGVMELPVGAIDASRTAVGDEISVDVL